MKKLDKPAMRKVRGRGGPCPFLGSCGMYGPGGGSSYCLTGWCTIETTSSQSNGYSGGGGGGGVGGTSTPYGY